MILGQEETRRDIGLDVEHLGIQNSEYAFAMEQLGVCHMCYQCNRCHLVVPIDVIEEREVG